MKTFTIFFVPAFLAIFLTWPLHAANVMVFAAASLTDVMKTIAADYEKQSGDKIIFNFGASSTLERQIEEGAPADIFFSADEAQMNRLEKKDLIVSATRKSILGNSLVVVVPNDSALKIHSARDLTNSDVKQIALA
ncbi:MAG TPA: molybdate ABC transporter substrate-binding protein, partial [Verrucomicrobiae bacterium]|nr:molybdate ABC transporter substrate-binding protein [Verrucomicrobiae bacterium]